MSRAVQQLLDSFDVFVALREDLAALQIRRRVLPATSGDVPEPGLIEAADELFRTLDAEEAAHAQS
jgi:hypothetical protein